MAEICRDGAVISKGLAGMGRDCCRGDWQGIGKNWYRQGIAPGIGRGLAEIDRDCLGDRQGLPRGLA